MHVFINENISQTCEMIDYLKNDDNKHIEHSKSSFAQISGILKNNFSPEHQFAESMDGTNYMYM